jgi:hypothetical protein
MLNQLINVFWTVVSFTAVGYYWGLYFAEKRAPLTLVVIVILSILFYLTPRKWLSLLTLSNNRRIYERIGVRLILWFVQNGTFVNRIQRKFGKQRGMISSRKNALAYLSTIDMQERYHYCCLVFFALSSVSALVTGRTEEAFYISLSNIVYNIYPILLQQYSRLRIEMLLSGNSMANGLPSARPEKS